MAKLIVRKDKLDSEVGYSHNGSSYSVKLSEATQAQLRVLAEQGVDVFEKPDNKPDNKPDKG